MARVLYSVLYLGPYAVYTSPTGLTDLRTGKAENGGGFNVGDYMELTEKEANAWSQPYAGQGPLLHEGRYRIVGVSPQAVAANSYQGAVVGIAPGNVVQAATILTAGIGQTAGTYTATATGGTFTSAAVLQYVIGAAGTLISATIQNGGSYSSPTVPTFTIAAGGTPGTVQAQLIASSNYVTTFDASAINVLSARGTFLQSMTAAQITAGAWVLIQEDGIGQVYVTNTTTTTSGSILWSATNSTVTSNVGTASYTGTLGWAIDAPVANSLCRFQFNLPIRQG
jgi:hypothetical protein